MRIIPGNTKVKIEIFNGISLWDILAMAIAGIMLACIVVSTLPYRGVFAIIHIFFSVLLIARLDKEPNYMYLLHIIRHFGFKRHFKRMDTDQLLKERADRGTSEVILDEILQPKGEQTPEEPADMPPVETKAERKARIKREKEEYKADTKLLKSHKLSKEEEDAIWLKRANQSKANKESKAAGSSAKKKSRIKWDDMPEASAFSGIKDGFIEYGKGKYYGAVIEVPSVEFKFFSSSRRNNAIEYALGGVIRAVRSDYSLNLIKIERPVSYDHYLDNEMKKLEDLRQSYEQGFIKEEELKSRIAIVYDRIYALKALKDDNKVVIPFYYLVLFDTDKKQLKNSVRSALDNLRIGEMDAKPLTSDRDIAIFLRYTNSLDFDEKEIDSVQPEDYALWAMPEKLEFTPRTAVVNGMVTHNLRVVNYPTSVYDAWLASLMTYPSTKVVVKMKPMDRGKSITAIDKSLAELRGKVATASTDSQAMEAQQHLDTLQMLLATLQSESEALLDVNIYITAYDLVATQNNPKLDPLDYNSFRLKVSSMKKTIKRVWREAGFVLNNMEFNQALAYYGSQVSGYDPMDMDGRGIPSNTIAASFPWVFPHIMDEKGVQLGTADGVPVFIDFFRRDSERVNSNMVIIGKSGSGKSYATKSLLSNLAADDSKIFILDPEDEYTTLAKNLNGKFINVANAKYGRLNPFHIITTLDDDESDGTATSSYATHLQFLEEFFKQILPDCDKDSLEYLNSLVDRVYAAKGINAFTDLSKLKPADYPIFDDLYDEILREFQRTDNEYIKTMLRTLMNYVSKFSEGGRNSVIWDGPSTVTTEENFTVFNFQSLLANRNSTIANAQMLLVLKYIDNEIIKNRDYNEKYGLNRKIVVVIDEAHVFIDTKFPVALDFMFQLAKRIRKYNGMQIVITQNIKDFVGSEEIARKSTAIINACQYSFIFSLAPNDMEDLCRLYEKAGGINESEQEQIVQAQRGHAFTVMSPTSRSSFKVTVPDGVVDLFTSNRYTNPYFRGEEGAGYWNDYIGESPAKREENLRARGVIKDEPEAEETVVEEVSPGRVSFGEFTEEEYQISAIETAKNAVSFSESSDIPLIPFDEETEDLLNLKKEISDFKLNIPSEQPAAPVQPVQTSAAVQPEAAVHTKTEEILAGLVDKLATANMMEEIKKAVRSEVEKEMENRVPAAVSSSAPVSAPASVPAEEEEEGGDAFANFFSDLATDDEEPSSEPETAAEEEEESGSASLGSIFDFANLAEMDDYDESTAEIEDEDESDDEEETAESDHFDIMSFLAQQADESEASGSDSLIEDFINGSETKLDVTLEQLIAFNRKKK